MTASNVPLRQAAESGITTNQPGVYILWLGGSIMKVGSAQIGIQKRMQQYYALNPHCGLNTFINSSNRDRITVSYQTCTQSQCSELESRLFDKYSPIYPMPWASRRPHVMQSTCALLI